MTGNSSVPCFGYGQEGHYRVRVTKEWKRRGRNGMVGQIQPPGRKYSWKRRQVKRGRVCKRCRRERAKSWGRERQRVGVVRYKRVLVTTKCGAAKQKQTRSVSGGKCYACGMTTAMRLKRRRVEEKVPKFVKGSENCAEGSKGFRATFGKESMKERFRMKKGRVLLQGKRTLLRRGTRTNRKAITPSRRVRRHRPGNKITFIKRDAAISSLSGQQSTRRKRATGTAQAADATTKWVDMPRGDSAHH